MALIDFASPDLSEVGSEVSGHSRQQGFVFALWVVVIYAALGAAGLSLAIAPGYASPVFPAAGFALSVFARV